MSTPYTPEAFPWMREPWKHQREIFIRAAPMRDYALFAEMGTGKTFTTINILRWRYVYAGRLMRTLVLCPPIVRENWRREFKMSSKLGDKVHVLKGPGKKRAALFAEQAFAEDGERLGAIFVTNYESLQMKEVRAAIQRWRPEVVVYDECHKLKNPKATRTKLAIALADMADHRYILTGSPVLNTPMDIWAQFRCLDKGQTFDANFWAFRANYFVDKNAGMPKEKYFPDWKPRDGLAAEFNAKIYRKASRVLKKDCLDLPPLVKKRLEVDMGAEQRRAYLEMRTHLVAYLDSKECVARLALTKILRLQQIACGHFSADDGTVTRFKDNPRLEAAAAVLDEVSAAHKVIVWATFREDVGALRERFDAMGLQPLTLIGGLTANQQQLAIDSFQNDPAHRVLIANPQAAGVGINLTAASYSLYFSRTFSLEADIQSESRNYRGGSEVHEKVTRIDIVCPKSVDETILAALQAKETSAEAILSRVRGSTSAF